MYRLQRLRRLRTSSEPVDASLLRLKAAVEAGYYRTEAAVGEQITFPWQNRICRDCPYWRADYCTVHADFRSSTSPTCREDDIWREARAVGR